MPTERPFDPVVVILRDGRERVLRYPLGKLKQAKKEFGASIIGGKGLMDLDEDKLPKLIWYGLSSDDPDLKAEDLDTLIEASDLRYLIEKISAAFGIQIATPKNDASSQPEAAQAAMVK